MSGTHPEEKHVARGFRTLHTARSHCKPPFLQPQHSRHSILRVVAEQQQQQQHERGRTSGTGAASSTHHQPWHVRQSSCSACLESTPKLTPCPASSKQCCRKAYASFRREKQPLRRSCGSCCWCRAWTWNASHGRRRDWFSGFYDSLVMTGFAIGARGQARVKPEGKRNVDCANKAGRGGGEVMSIM